MLIPIVIGFAAFVQTAFGFGIALVSMPILTALIGLHIAAPLVALIALTIRLFMIRQYFNHLKLSEVWRLMAAAIIGIPFGFIAYYHVPQHLVESILGVVVVGYATFILIKPKIQRLEHPSWPYSLGFASGILAGAYNIGGPPAVVYATGRQWEPTTFKGNLQAISLVSGFLVIFTRATNQEFTETVFAYYLLALPMILVGIGLGFWSDRRLDTKRFQHIVLYLLMALGISLIL